MTALPRPGGTAPDVAVHEAANTPRLAALTRYRCRSHIEQPISWKGTGCPTCPSTARRRGRRPANRATRTENHR